MADLVSRGWPAPAKLNRFLHITGRRADGFHNLQTIFQFIDFCDELDFTLRDDGEITLLNAVEGVADQDNLVVRAAMLLQQHSGTQTGVDIAIRKILPMGGGLGGGSSDAATVLVALNQLWQTGLSQQALMQLGLQLGADVPVFVHARAVWAEGVGEKFTDVALDEAWFCVIVPAVNVATAAIFADAELTRDSRPVNLQDFIDGNTGNDCQAVVCQHYPQVELVLSWMREHIDQQPGCIIKSQMTGTGACVFAGFRTQQDAVEIKQQLPEGWTALVAQGQNQSPLTKRLQQERGQQTVQT